MKTGQAVLVTTEFRGVFFGYLKKFDELPGEVMLTNARNVVYWSADCKGFLGLAAHGPTADCRVGPAVSELTLWKVTSLTPVSDDAIAKWESAPWK